MKGVKLSAFSLSSQFSRFGNYRHEFVRADFFVPAEKYRALIGTCAQDHNFVRCTFFDVYKGVQVQFYNLEGIEEDVQDPRFFIDEELMIAQQEAIAEMLSTYA